MDISTLIGIILGFVLIVVAILSGGGDLGNFFDATSILIVIGGTLSAVIASFPFSVLKSTFSHFGKLMGGKQFKVEPVIDSLVEFAQIARKNGLLALEEQANGLKDPFFKQGIMLVVDAMEAEKVREMLETEVAMMDKRHDDQIGIYEKAAGYAPAFGMIGTLVGLINMLANMDLAAGSSSSIGKDMGVALITTLYGSTFANLVLAPIAKKLRIKNEEEVLYKQIIIEGVIGIQAGENPKNLKEKLVSLLHEKRKIKLLNTEASAGDAPAK